MMRSNLTYGTKSTYQVVCDSFLRRGFLLLYIENSLRENNALTYVLNLLGEHLRMTHYTCLSNKPSYFSRLTLYIEHVINKWYSSYIPYSVTLHVILKHIMTIPTQLRSRLIAYTPSICGWDLTCSYNHATTALYFNSIPISIILSQCSLLDLDNVLMAFLKFTKQQYSVSPWSKLSYIITLTITKRLTMEHFA